VTASVNGKFHEKSQHRLIRLKYILKGVQPKKREFYEFERKVRDKTKDEDKVKNFLLVKLSAWYHSYAPLVFSSWGNEWIEREKESDEKNTQQIESSIRVSHLIVDQSVIDLCSLISDTIEWSMKTVKTRLPDTIPRHANAQAVKLGQLCALLGEFSLKISKDPNNQILREKFQRIEAEKVQVIQKIAQEKLNSKMKYLNDKVKRCSRDFFDITGKVIARDQFTDKANSGLSKEEKIKKLKANDVKFKNDDPNFGKYIDDFKLITPDRYWSSVGWLPYPGTNVIQSLIFLQI